jgi:uncharacterized protein DUF6600
MKRRIVVLAAAAALGGLSSLMSGCAAEDAQAREADYPAPIGYTVVGTSSNGAPSSPPPAPAPQQSPAAWAPGSGPPGAPPPTGDAPGYGPPPAPPYAVGAPGTDSAPPPPDQAPGGPVGDGADEQGGYADTDPSALSDFRSTLDPYGNWVDDPTYGTVWSPSPSVVGPDFSPYVSAGHWAYDDDYVWVSDYDWGWAPFHYGRWVYAGPMGWEWIPGRTYAGAWVSWRYGVGDWGFVGWAPLGPTWCWRGGVAVGVGFVPRAPYSFVGTHDLFGQAVARRLVTGPQVGVVATHTQPFVPSSPRVGSSIGLRYAVGGPSLGALGLSPSTAVRVSATSDRGLAQARAYARPNTAVALGARGPQLYGPRSQVFPSTRLSGAFVGGGASMSSARIPAYASPEPSHFGGRMGVGFTGNVAAAPPPRFYSGPAVGYGAPREAPSSYATRPSMVAPGGYARGYSQPSAGYSGGGRVAAPSTSSGGSFHSSGGMRGGGGGGRGGGHR